MTTRKIVMKTHIVRQTNHHLQHIKDILLYGIRKRD